MFRDLVFEFLHLELGLVALFLHALLLSDLLPDLAVTLLQLLLLLVQGRLRLLHLRLNNKQQAGREQGLGLGIRMGYRYEVPVLVLILVSFLTDSFLKSLNKHPLRGTSTSTGTGIVYYQFIP